MSPTFLYELRGNTLITVHGELAPRDDEWGRYLQACVRYRDEVPDVDRARSLVFSDGGGPNARQRAQLFELADVAKVPSVVVTQSMVARGIVTAFGWLGSKLRAFPHAELQRAFDYLDIPAEERAAHLACVARLRAQLLGETLDTSSQGLNEVELITFVATRRLSQVRERLQSRQPHSDSGND